MQTETQATPAARRRPGDDPPPLHLILADDEPHLPELYRDYLASAAGLAPEGVGLRLHVATSGEESLRIARAIRDRGERVACALIDYNLGRGPDGIDTSLALWEIDPEIQCTLVSGAGDLGDAQTVQRVPERFLPNWDFLAKPCGPFVIVQRVRRSVTAWIARRSAEEHAKEIETLVTELSRVNTALEAKVRERTADLAQRNEELERNHRELEHAFAELERAQHQLLQSEKMASIGQLAAGVTHELNNPIGFVHSNLGTLERYAGTLGELLDAYEARLDPDDEELSALRRRLKIDFLREDLPALVSESREGTERVRKIVSDLKVFSHPGGTGPAFSDIAEGLESTLNIVHNELKYKAKVVREFGELPRVRCLPDQINQVFMNILVNAAQAMEDFGEIRVAARADGDDVVVTIADNGPGIPPEILERVFDPFVTTKEAGKGTGLGLSISFDIVRKHGGELSVKSEQGKGAAFTVRLPVQGPPEADPGSGANGVPQPDGGAK